MSNARAVMPSAPAICVITVNDPSLSRFNAAQFVEPCTIANRPPVT